MRFENVRHVWMGVTRQPVLELGDWLAGVHDSVRAADLESLETWPAVGRIAHETQSYWDVLTPLRDSLADQDSCADVQLVQEPSALGLPWKLTYRVADRYECEFDGLLLVASEHLADACRGVEDLKALCRCRRVFHEPWLVTEEALHGDKYRSTTNCVQLVVAETKLEGQEVVLGESAAKLTEFADVRLLHTDENMMSVTWTGKHQFASRGRDLHVYVGKVHQVLEGMARDLEIGRRLEHCLNDAKAALALVRDELPGRLREAAKAMTRSPLRAVFRSTSSVRGMQAILLEDDLNLGRTLSFCDAADSLREKSIWLVSAENTWRLVEAGRVPEPSTYAKVSHPHPRPAHVEVGDDGTWRVVDERPKPWWASDVDRVRRCIRLRDEARAVFDTQLSRTMTTYNSETVRWTLVASGIALVLAAVALLATG